MKAFKKIFCAVIAVIIVLFVAANYILINADRESGRPYKVEISRLVYDMEQGNTPDISACNYVTDIVKCTDDFYDTDSDYVIYKVNGELYRFEYSTRGESEIKRFIITINIFLGLMAVIILVVMLYMRWKILNPFEKLSDVPYELSKGNLTSPIKETKNRFFGKFIWGVDMLRENIEQQKERELDLQKERKMLLLSLSHDIKTPLSAIKLYSKALSKGLYTDKEKQLEIAENINTKADEIESYVSQIITASREDFLSLDVNVGEFYLSELVTKITRYYSEKLSLIKIDFSVGKYDNCLLNGDIDRGIEVVQNIIENAVKYGDGKSINLSFSEEEGCILITVQNSGCTLSDTDLPHIFESFWRGTNADNIKGSGLGLYICRQLMRKMNGETFAEIKNGNMLVTAVFEKI